ncbi:MAG TPA: helix-hairpin-helix domain-containing protein [Polyangiaceae bacterium]|nr:helix-hairpin-helix domain-containing protein [Polyangiaceae bacterium]
MMAPTDPPVGTARARARGARASDDQGRTDAHSEPAARTGAGLHNEDVVAAFEEMSELLAIRGENPFRVRAYQRAAQVVRSQARPVAELRASDQLAELPGIGSDLAGKIGELLETETFAALEQARKSVPAGLRELLRVPGLGPTRVRALNAKLSICSVDDLREALAAGKLQGLRGFGPGLQKRLQQALATRQSEPSRWMHSVAAQYAEPLRGKLSSRPRHGGRSRSRGLRP